MAILPGPSLISKEAWFLSWLMPLAVGESLT